MTAQAPQHPVGQVEEGKDEDDEEIDEEIKVEDAPQQQVPPPLPPLPNFAEVMAAQTQWLQRLTQIVEQGVQHGVSTPDPKMKGYTTRSRGSFD